MKTFTDYFYPSWKKEVNPKDAKIARDAWDACAVEYEKILDRYKKLLDIAYEVIDKVKELYP